MQNRRMNRSYRPTVQRTQRGPQTRLGGPTSRRPAQLGHPRLGRGGAGEHQRLAGRFRRPAEADGCNWGCRDPCLTRRGRLRTTVCGAAAAVGRRTQGIR